SPEQSSLQDSGVSYHISSNGNLEIGRFLHFQSEIPKYEIGPATVRSRIAQFDISGFRIGNAGIVRFQNFPFFPTSSLYQSPAAALRMGRRCPATQETASTHREA